MLYPLPSSVWSASALRAASKPDDHWTPDDPGTIVPRDLALQPGTEMKIGSPKRSPSDIRRRTYPTYLYVFGRVEYLDGFDQWRFTNFCHRYNCEVPFESGESKLPAGNGRYHEHGNSAD